MAASDLINLSGLIDNAKCFALLRQHRWPQGARCPVCGSGAPSRTAATTRSPVASATAARHAPGVLTFRTGKLQASWVWPSRMCRL